MIEAREPWFGIASVPAFRQLHLGGLYEELLRFAVFLLLYQGASEATCRIVALDTHRYLPLSHLLTRKKNERQMLERMNG